MTKVKGLSQKKKKKPLDSDNGMITSGERWEEAEESRGEINGGGRAPD